MTKYDYLIVGAGLFGSTFARVSADMGSRVLVIDKSSHVAGAAYTENISGINVHVHGAHIFHTDDLGIWQFVCRFSEFIPYVHMVKACVKDKLFSFPFNMMTFHQLWGCTTPLEAQELIKQKRVHIDQPRNLEEWALSQIGSELYELFIYGYTKKQWRRDPKELPASILKRIPIRFTYDERYFSDRFQGIPTHGYTKMVENMLDGIDLRLNTDFKEIKDWRSLANTLVYSGSIDELLNYKHGPLEYRTLEFKRELVDGDRQGTSTINYPDFSIPYTRTIEHKHFSYQTISHTIVSQEFPVPWNIELPRYYPINDEKNRLLYKKYISEIHDGDIIVGGRLGAFQYMDMHQVIGSAISLATKNRRIRVGNLI